MRSLKESLLAGAPVEGKHATAVPGLWLNRAHCPVLHKRVAAPSVTFAVIVQGEKHVVFGGQRLVYGPGHYLLITGEQRYLATIESASRDAPYLSLALVLSPDDVATALLELSDAGETSFADDPPAVVSALDDGLTDALTRLLALAITSDSVDARVLAPLVVREIVFRLLRSDGASALRRASREPDQRITRAVTFMREHAHQRLTVDRIARKVAMSPSHFAHRFREVVRVSPMQFVRHVRLHRARLLLLDDTAAAAEVAREVGYASASHFSRDFKSHFGAPPRAYTRRFRLAAG